MWDQYNNKLMYQFYLCFAEIHYCIRFLSYFTVCIAIKSLSIACLYFTCIILDKSSITVCDKTDVNVNKLMVLPCIH